MEHFIHKLKSELAKPLPGVEAQYIMAPMARQRIDIKSLEKNEYKLSAVMILLCKDENDQFFIPLIERFAYKGAHSAQISFPGGKYEDSDENLQNTAIRECFEEIGLRNEVEIIGKLTSLFIPVSSFLVEPYVAFCEIKNPTMFPHEREVKGIIKLPVAKLLDEEIVEQGTVDVDDFKIKTPYFLAEGYKVWGATAMMLSELKAVLSR